MQDYDNHTLNCMKDACGLSETSSDGVPQPVHRLHHRALQGKTNQTHRIKHFIRCKIMTTTHWTAWLPRLIVTRLQGCRGARGRGARGRRTRGHEQAAIARASCKLQTHVQTNQTNQTHGIKHDMKFNQMLDYDNHTLNCMKAMWMTRLREADPAEPRARCKNMGKLQITNHNNHYNKLECRGPQMCIGFGKCSLVWP